jgi:hypothetical protein
VTCVVVLTSETVLARIDEDEVNSVLIKVVETASVETRVVAKDVKTLEFAGEGVMI